MTDRPEQVYRMSDTRERLRRPDPDIEGSESLAKYITDLESALVEAEAQRDAQRRLAVQAICRSYALGNLMASGASKSVNRANAAAAIRAIGIELIRALLAGQEPQSANPPENMQKHIQTSVCKHGYQAGCSDVGCVDTKYGRCSVCLGGWPCVKHPEPEPREPCDILSGCSHDDNRCSTPNTEGLDD